MTMDVRLFHFRWALVLLTQRANERASCSRSIQNSKSTFFAFTTFFLPRPEAVVSTMASAHASIECSDQPLDVSFHPSRPHLVAAALVDGTIEVHDFDYLVGDNNKNAKNNEADDISVDEEDEQDTIVSSTAVHTQLLPSKEDSSATKQASCRAISFSHDGSQLYTGGSGGDLACLDAERLCTFSASQSGNNSVTWRIPDAAMQREPIQVIHELPASRTHSITVTGDEAGGVRLWDPRLCSSNYGSSNSSRNSVASHNGRPVGCVQSWKQHDDYISGIEHSEDGNTVVVSSADCTLSVYDLRMASQNQNKEKCVRRSDDQGDELLSCKIIKNGRKVVCGTGEGVLHVWSWGTWGDVSDRFPGHPSSVDALLKVDENTLLTGSSDGLIRVVSIHPDKLLGVLGDHDGFPIEKLQFNADHGLVGSVTHDNMIRLWDASLLEEYEIDDDEDDEKDEKADVKMGVSSQTTSAVATGQGSDDEWDDMDEEMEDDDGSDDDDNNSDDSDSDDSSGGKGKGKKATTNDKRAKRLQNNDNSNFFADL
jgi:WD40 repeat protein